MGLKRTDEFRQDVVRIWGATFAVQWQAGHVTTSTSRAVRSAIRISNFKPRVRGSQGRAPHSTEFCVCSSPKVIAEFIGER